MKIFQIAVILFLICIVFSTQHKESHLYWDANKQLKLLEKCPFINSKSKSQIKLSTPTLDGDTKTFYMYKSPVMPEELSSKYSDIHTYTGIGINDPSDRISITQTGKDVMGMILSNNENIFISKLNENELYKFSNKEFEDSANRHGINCGNVKLINQNSLNRKNGFDSCIGEDEPCYSMGSQKVKYRVAIIMTEAVTNKVGNGTVEGGISWLASMVNQLNLLWRRELNYELEIISNNDILIFTNQNPAPSKFSIPNLTCAKDPFFPADDDGNPKGDPKYCEIDNVEPYLELVIGVGGYNAPDDTRLWEYGMVLNTTYNGGLAQVEGPISASNDSYEVINHELGHNLGSYHNLTIENGYKCTFGGTIMGSRDRTVSGSVGDQYSIHTLEQAHKIFNTYPDEYGDAYAYLRGYTSSKTNKIIPELNTPTSGFSIPKDTPFVLEGTSVPHDLNYLFSWEQNDASSISYNLSDLNTWPISEGPLFCSVDLHNKGNKRFFPAMNTLLKNEYSTKFNNLTIERLPFGTRDINMRLQVRTNEIEGGAVNFKNVKFTVDNNSGPFRLTSQPDSVNWVVESTQTITWDVANTNLDPVNCLNVDILLSTDAGRNFNTLLAESTFNDGTEDIIVPFIASVDSCRIMVKSSDNIFFDINNAYFTISNPNIPSILVNTDNINIESYVNSQIDTLLVLTNNGQLGSVLDYEIIFLDSIYINENFEGLDLDNSKVTQEYILPNGWERTTNGRGWIVGTEETSAYEDWILSQVGDFYFDIPTWPGGNYIYTDDEQYNPCSTCGESLDCYNLNGCTDGSADYLITPPIYLSNFSNFMLSFDSYSYMADISLREHFYHLEIFIDDIWNNIATYQVEKYIDNIFILRSYDLSEYKGKDIKIRFHSESKETTGYTAGWAIDNVKLISSPSWLTSNHEEGELLSEASISLPISINTNNLNVGQNYQSKIIIIDRINNISDTSFISIDIVEGGLEEALSNDNQLPTNYKLYNPYPNPFNPVTSIKYLLSEASDVSIVIYDMQGREVDQLYHGRQLSGSHIINWDASGNVSGIYFIKMEAGDSKITKKLMLIK